MKDTEDKYLEAIINNFIVLITEKNIDVATIAAAANLDRKQVYRFINRENVPELTTFLRIVLATGFTPSDIFNFNFDFKEYMKSVGIQKIVHTEENSLKKKI
ncbi:helix-turn-helix domain-containing protein [Myroides odoratus]